MKIKYLLPIIVISAVASRASATTVIPPTFQQLVQQAEVIFQGTVTNVRSTWEGEGGQRHISSYVTFQVQDSLKGTPGATYTIKMLGGTVGEDSFVITDAPQFQVGDNDVLFVENNGQQFVPLVGIMYGRFQVQHDVQTARDIVLSNEGGPVQNVAMLGRAEGSEVSAGPTMALDDFKAAIKTELNTANAQPSR